MYAKKENSLKKIFIIGPTGSGKSALAAQLADQLKGAIINVDSCQIYQGLPILTAQPSQQEQQKQPHYLYGFLSPSQSYNVATYLKDVHRCLEPLSEITQIFVGGTGLYFKALKEGLLKKETPPSLKKQARQDQEEKGNSWIYQILQENIPLFSLHRNDHSRLLRAYELYLMSQKKGTSPHLENSPPLCPDPFVIFINPDPTQLRSSLKERIEKMIKYGAIEEVDHLLKVTTSFGATPEKIIGLKEISDMLKGEIGRNEAQEKMYFRTCQYAKRQRTWFRHQIKKDYLIEHSIEGEMRNTQVTNLLLKINTSRAHT